MDLEGPPASSKRNHDFIETARRVLRLETAALTALAGGLDGSFANAVNVVLQLQGRLICSGLGKSGHIARKIAATLASTGTPAYYVHPSEASHGDLGMITPDDAVLALSRSGETRELNDLIAYSGRHGVALIAMTARPESALGRASDICLAIPDMPEACDETQAPTTSTTVMLALGDALAVAALEARGFRSEDFKTFHPGGTLGALLLKAGDMMRTDEALPIARSGLRFEQGLAIMSEKSAGCVGVVNDEGVLVGMVTDGDIRRHALSGSSAPDIDHVMTRNPRTVGAETLASAIMREMNQRAITQVFVVEAGRPVGLVHLHDLLKAGLS